MVVIRIKAVSSCMRIRRSYMGYMEYKDQEVSLLSSCHPLKSFKGVSIHKDTITWKEEARILGNEEMFFHLKSQMDTGSGVVLEEKAMGVRLVSIDLDMVKRNENLIKQNILFDEYAGELEYQIGLYYDFIGDNKLAEEWYKKAQNKGFSFGFLEAN